MPSGISRGQFFKLKNRQESTNFTSGQRRALGSPILDSEIRVALLCSPIQSREGKLIVIKLTLVSTFRFKGVKLTYERCFNSGQSARY
jgi:hypothetical protein